jgi:hypothetical protein
MQQIAKSCELTPISENFNPLPNIGGFSRNEDTSAPMFLARRVVLEDARQ